MKIILLKSVPKLGQAGEIKEVNDGYARNFLIPKGLADIVTKHGLNVLGAQKKKKDRIKAMEAKSRKALAKKLNGMEFKIDVKADEKGSLYAKLDNKTISKELEKQGYKVSANEINIKKPIKKLGEFEIDLNLEEEARIKIVLHTK